MTMGERIKARRKMLNLSQIDLAEMASVSQAQISAYELDKHEPTAYALVALAKALETTTDYLTGMTDSPAIVRDDNGLAEDERYLLETYRSKNHLQQEQLLRIAETL